MRGVVRKWGNGAAVRIPASVLVAARLRVGQVVELREEGGRIVIEAIAPAAWDLDALVAGITDENRHEPVETGGSVGREVWK